MELQRLAIRRHVDAHRAAILGAWFDTQFAPDRLRRFAVPGTTRIDRGEITASFLSPLLDLLTTFVETGDDRCRAVYLDERLRYAPHQSGPAERTAFFAETLPLDELALLSGAANAPLAEALKQIHSPLLASSPASAIHMLAVGDCLMNDVRVFLPALAAAAGVTVDMRCLYFSAPVGRDISTQQVVDFIGDAPMDLLAFSFLSYEGIPPYAALLREADGISAAELTLRVDAIAGIIRRFLEEVRRHTDAPFLLHNASGLPLTPLRRRVPFVPAISSGRRRAIEALNARIAEIAEHTANTLLLDEATVAVTEGYRESSAPVAPRAINRRALFHTAEFGRFLATPYLDVVRSLASLGKAKVLAVDLDNTLWDGVMADGEVHHYRDRQQALRRAREAGLLLVAVSKNDPANVRWDEMELKADDFVLHKISWELKAQSLRQAADSFVLIDDNPAERELVRTQLPAVTTLDATDPHTWQSVERVLRFANTKNTEEARHRTELYRRQALRREALSAQFDYPQMMTALQLEARFAPATPDDIERVAELVQRTNQFNTTTTRYTRQQLEALLVSETHHVYVATLADKFGALGLVAAAIVRREGGDATFESFVMSCRAMGFQLEQLVVALVLDAEHDAERFVGRFIATDRNTPALNLYRDCGFRALGGGIFERLRNQTALVRPAWFTVVAR
jgi:FkbH-like protein